MGALIAVVAATLLISATCSLWEAALYSARTGVLEAAAGDGRLQKVARRFLKMREDIAVPTSAILILNTVANTAGATLAGMYASREFGAQTVLLISAGLTVSILFFAEILPKTVGAVYWRRIWPLMVWPLVTLETLLRPIIWVTRRFANLFTRGQKLPDITEEEIRAMIRVGATEGEVTPGELRLLNAVFHFDEIFCRQIMVPRRDVVYLDAEWDFEKAIEVAQRTRHTRFPLVRGSLDDVEGLVHIKDLVGVRSDRPFELTSVTRPLRPVPETMPINRLLREMQSTHQHMSLVVDEFGTAVGIITMENILEQIVGAVQDEFDTETPEIVPEGKGAYTVQGNLALEKVNRELGLKLDSDDVDTVSGLLVTRLDRLPKTGDVVEVEGAVATVLEVQSGRATEIRLQLDRDPQRVNGAVEMRGE